jgi:phosphohistidine swiveling domain-containing protein
MLHALGEQRLKLHAEAENLINQEQVFYDYIKNKCGYKDRHVRMLMQEEVMRAFAGLCVSESLLDDRREGSVMFRNENAVYVIETGGVYTKFKNEIEKSLPKQIKGVIAYKGKVTGKVVRHLSWSGTKHIDPGSILVTGMTNPQMIPLIRNAGAIVTDEGGLTCHAAIIAREMKIPCIVGTQIATQILRDGDQIVVDAHQGIVEKI